jgi:hypothetical protein
MPQNPAKILKESLISDGKQESGGLAESVHTNRILE